MRRGIAGDFPHLQGRDGVQQRAVGATAQAPALTQQPQPLPPSTQRRPTQSLQAQPVATHHGAAPDSAAPVVGTSADVRANIARLFFDLRSVMRLTPEAAAFHLQTDPSVIAALEAGRFEALPVWPETARIITAYTALAGIDGRPVLAAIAGCLQAVAHPSVNPHRHPRLSAMPVQRLRQAGSALAHGAKRLPAGAIKQVRERPERAFYAVSLPLGVLLLILNSGSLQSAMHHMPRPMVRMAADVRHFFQEQFAPVHDGLRWIEVDNPRRRRGDKLPRPTQSD